MKRIDVHTHMFGGAGNNMPAMLHSGILYDGINPSGKYNRPCEFEPLLSIENFRFSLAHLSWPWADEEVKKADFIRRKKREEKKLGG